MGEEEESGTPPRDQHMQEEHAHVRGLLWLILACLLLGSAMQFSIALDLPARAPSRATTPTATALLFARRHHQPSTPPPPPPPDDDTGVALLGLFDR